MANECCTQTLKVTKIKVEENGKQLVFLNPEKEKYLKTKVDGCLIEQAVACDWWVVRGKDDSVLVELKGQDVDHALAQIEATFLHLKENGNLTKNMAAVIVCRKPSQRPSFTAKLQRAKSRLSLAYKAPLHIFSGNREVYISDVLAQKWP